MLRCAPRSTFFPYTTLFRSNVADTLASSSAQLADLVRSLGTTSTASCEIGRATSELQSPDQLVCRQLLAKKNCQIARTGYHVSSICIDFSRTAERTAPKRS